MMKNCKNIIFTDQNQWHKGRKLFKNLVFSVFCLFLVSNSFSTNYYVAISGNDTNDGLSSGNAWRTVTYAATKANAGDIIYVKAGIYKGEYVDISNSGTENAPIIFQGYQYTPGDTPNPHYIPGGSLDANALPVLEGNDLTGTAFTWGAKKYIEIRNFGINLYEIGIYPRYWIGISDHILIEKVYSINQSYSGFWFRECNNIIIRNCVIADSYWFNLLLDITDNCLVDNVKSYATVYEPSSAATDYHIQIRDSHDNIIQNSLASNLHDLQTNAHPGHGIGIKDNYKNGYSNPHSYNNKIINCETHNMGENFYVSHEAYNNLFENCTVKSNFPTQNYWSDGIGIRDGAHDNNFQNFKVECVRTSISIQETVEGPDTEQRCSNNTITNCQFTNSNIGIQISNSDNNLIKNCVFDSTGQWSLIRFTDEIGRKCNGNICRSSIVTNITGEFQLDEYNSNSSVAFTYSNFWNNSFSMPEGEGNIAKNPLFVDRANRDYHLKSTQGHWDEKTSTWVIDSETSHCIDKGQPTDDCTVEPSPNGNIINIGVYGGTTEASKSPKSTITSTKTILNTEELTIYPNPFSVSLTINYSSTAANYVNIALYDIQGRQVKNLLDGNIFNGLSIIQWDGTNSFKQNVKSGIFFLKLRTLSGSTKTFKICHKQ